MFGFNNFFFIQLFLFSDLKTTFVGQAIKKCCYKPSRILLFTSTFSLHLFTLPSWFLIYKEQYVIWFAYLQYRKEMYLNETKATPWIAPALFIWTLQLRELEVVWVKFNHPNDWFTEPSQS